MHLSIETVQHKGQRLFSHTAHALWHTRLEEMGERRWRHVRGEMALGWKRGGLCTIMVYPMASTVLACVSGHVLHACTAPELSHVVHSLGKGEWCWFQTSGRRPMPLSNITASCTHSKVSECCAWCTPVQLHCPVKPRSNAILLLHVVWNEASKDRIFPLASLLHLFDTKG